MKFSKVVEGWFGEKKAPAQFFTLNEGQPDENTPHLVLSTMK